MVLAREPREERGKSNVRPACTDPMHKSVHIGSTQYSYKGQLQQALSNSTPDTQRWLTISMKDVGMVVPKFKKQDKQIMHSGRLTVI